MQAVERSIIIDASKDVFFKVITDYEKYPEFIAEMVRVKVLSRAGDTVEVSYTLKAVIKEIQYTLRLQEKAPLRLEWKLTEGQMMKANDGSWQIEELGPQRIKATYSLQVALKSFLIPQSIVTTLMDVTLPKTMEAFKKRAESLMPASA